jgi:hypothetical protein
LPRRWASYKDSWVKDCHIAALLAKTVGWGTAEWGGWLVGTDIALAIVRRRT